MRRIYVAMAVLLSVAVVAQGVRRWVHYDPEKSKRRANVLFQSGERISGDIWVDPTSYRHNGALVGDDGRLILQTSDGTRVPWELIDEIRLTDDWYLDGLPNTSGRQERYRVQLSVPGGRGPVQLGTLSWQGSGRYLGFILDDGVFQHPVVIDDARGWRMAMLDDLKHIRSIVFEDDGPTDPVLRLLEDIEQLYRRGEYSQAKTEARDLYSLLSAKASADDLD